MSTPAPPTLGLREAAEACNVSVSTLRRRRDALREHGATETKDGWRIPIDALIRIGLMPSVTPPDTAPETQLKAGTTPPG